ncbi:MAG: exosortase system-associated protein, TIGR04073 family [Candidatus Omnitrophica bacterium]|nr:exosortase system-associated protein, TIGR04073 family [Candidatus Omnitrophota bacterium]
MIRIKYLILLGLLMVIIPSLGLAGYKYRFDERMNQRGQYELGVAEKVTRGFTNVLYGWTEMARTPIDWGERIDKGKIQAVAIGIPYGILRMVGRTVVGVFEIGTCYVPQEPIFSPIEGDVV